MSFYLDRFNKLKRCKDNIVLKEQSNTHQHNQENNLTHMVFVLFTRTFQQLREIYVHEYFLRVLSSVP